MVFDLTIQYMWTQGWWASALILGPADVACVLSHFSRVQLCATPWTVAHQAPPSMGVLQARILEWIAMPPSNVWGSVMVCMLLTKSA